MIIKIFHRVKFYETDLMGVVHHANYIRFLEMGRVEFLRQAGITLNELMDDGFLFPITQVSAEYFHPATFDDELCIEVTPVELTKAKMVFSYQIFLGETLCVKASSQNVFTNKETGKITRLPQKYYEKLELALK